MKKQMRNQVMVAKSVSDEDLKLINQYTRRELTAEEVFVFETILCDNEIDRDGEAFSLASLHKFCELYPGKTGIFDHNPRGESQMARMFKAWVEHRPEQKTRYGAPYAALHGKAYMVRSGRSADLILEIDGGIKKEVSVGCSVARKLCSICGTNWKKERCSHAAGEEYSGEICFAVLDDPVDAYEWSFVAVPAQPAAGVVKAYTQKGEFQMNQMDQIVKNLDPSQGEELKAYLSALEAEAQAGRAYLAKLKKEVLSLSCLSGAKIQGDVMQSVIQKMNVQELEAFHKAFSAQLDEPGALQLTATPMQQPKGADSAFQI